MTDDTRRTSRARDAVTAALVAVLVAVLGAYNATGASAITSRRHQDRRFAIGYRDMTFVDTSRPTPAASYSDAQATRRLPTRVWYPARHKGRNVRPAGKRLPTVLFSHGTGGDRTDLDAPSTVRHWIEAGYVVVSPTFPLSSGVPCEKVTRAAPTTRCKAGSTVGVADPSRLADTGRQAGDASFVLDRVLELNHTAKSPLHDLVDPTRVAAAGFSQGTGTALDLSHSEHLRDPRIRASIAMSGCAFSVGSGAFFTRADQPPLLVTHGDADPTVPYACGEASYEQAATPKFFLTLHGVAHSIMPIRDYPGPGKDECAVPSGAVTCRVTLDFLDAYLKGDASALDRLRHDADAGGFATLQESLATPPSP